MTLTIGKRYKKADFGIGGIVRQWSEITVEGESMYKYSNSLTVTPE